MSSDRRPNAIIDQAYVEAASPDAVYTWMKERAPKKSRSEVAIPQALLEALTARQNRLINLALAQYCASRETLERLYREGDEALQCAVLGNPFFGDIFSFLLRDYIFSEPEHQRFVSQASSPLLEAYLSNPSLDPAILRALFDREPPFAAIEEDRWIQCVLFASSNTRLHRLGDSLDGGYGWNEFIHGQAIRAAWKLLDSLPAIDPWATLLERLYEKMVYYGVPRPIPEAERLQSDSESRNVTALPEDECTVELAFLRENFLKWRSSEERNKKFWNHFGELRRTIAARVGSSEPEINALLRDHEDKFVRQGYYQSFRPDRAADVAAAFDRDSFDFVEAAIENRWFYRKGHKPVCRALYSCLHGAESFHTDRGANPREIPWDEVNHLRDRYLALGVQWRNSDPELFEFDEDDLMRASDEDDEETIGWNRFPDLATIGGQVAALVRSSISQDDVRAGTVEAAQRLTAGLQKLEQSYQARVRELLEATANRFKAIEGRVESVDKMAMVLFWTVIVGFAMVLIFKH